MRQCAKCGAVEGIGEGLDWMTVSLVAGPGPRGDDSVSETSYSTTVTPDYDICPPCLASPWAAAIRDIADDDLAQSAPKATESCVMVCTEAGRSRWRVINWARVRLTKCPNCLQPARVLQWREAGSALRAMAGVAVRQPRRQRRILPIPALAYNEPDEAEPVTDGSPRAIMGGGHYRMGGSGL